jgi:hypothetical protein
VEFGEQVKSIAAAETRGEYAPGLAVAQYETMPAMERTPTAPGAAFTARVAKRGGNRGGAHATTGPPSDSEEGDSARLANSSARCEKVRPAAQSSQSDSRYRIERGPIRTHRGPSPLTRQRCALRGLTWYFWQNSLSVK